MQENMQKSKNNKNYNLGFFITMSRVITVLLLVMGVGLLIFYKKSPRVHMGSVPEKFLVQELKQLTNIIPVAIIGSGPAGLAAGLYTSRMNLYTVIFKGPQPGGQLTETSDVENWPGVGTMRGPVIMKKLESHVEHFGAELSTDTIERVDFNTWPYTLFTDDGVQLKALSVIIATGSSPVRLGVEGEDTYWGRGVSACATCDAPFYVGREVVVVGGGDSAAEAAMALATSGTKKVTLLVRGAAMRASHVMQERLKEYPVITVLYHTSTKNIYGDGSHVNGVELVTKPGILPSSYKQNSESISESITVKYPTDAVFLYIGHEPNTQLFNGLIDLDTHGYIDLKTRAQQTSKIGVFAAGDVADSVYRQAGVASGDGIKAGLDAINFLREHGFTPKLSKQLEGAYFDPSKVVTIDEIKSPKTSREYDTLIRDIKVPIVVDFYAPYCPSCMAMQPIFAHVAAQFKDKLLFLKVDVSVAPELAKRFDVPMIPAMLVIKDGKIASRSTEVMTKKAMRDYLKRYV